MSSNSPICLTKSSFNINIFFILNQNTKWLLEDITKIFQLKYLELKSVQTNGHSNTKQAHYEEEKKFFCFSRMNKKKLSQWQNQSLGHCLKYGGSIYCCCCRYFSCWKWPTYCALERLLYSFLLSLQVTRSNTCTCLSQWWMPLCKRWESRYNLPFDLWRVTLGFCPGQNTMKLLILVFSLSLSLSLCLSLYLSLLSTLFTLW